MESSGNLRVACRSPSPQERPIVIQRAHKVPEVRLYPPDSTEPVTDVFSNGEFSGGKLGVARHSFLPSNSSAFPWKTIDLSAIREPSPVPPPVPPVEPTETWNPFNARPANLTSFGVCQAASRMLYRPQSAAIQRVRAGWVSNSVKSLDILRQILQQSINKELDDVLRKYLEKFFAPAVDNIRQNNGESSVSDEHVHNVCRLILEDAKRMYCVSRTRGSTPVGDYSDSETGSHSDGRFGSAFVKSTATLRKRKDSDTDSEASQITRPKKKGRPPLHLSGQMTQSKLLKSESLKKKGPKWDPSRITKDTHFVMGARANKALGFGQTRGRLYIKHPELFKYCGDSEDKQWLFDNNLMPATGGKAYMLILEDIQELANKQEYRLSGALMLNELLSFTAPESMLTKMRTYMKLHRTDGPGRKPKGRPPLHGHAHAQLDRPTSSATPPGSDQNFDKPPSVGMWSDYGAASPAGSSGSYMKRSGIESSGPTSPIGDMDMIADTSAAQVSPFALSSGMEVSPTPSEMASSGMDPEPPLSAPFHITDGP